MVDLKEPFYLLFRPSKGKQYCETAAQQSILRRSSFSLIGANYLSPRSDCSAQRASQPAHEACLAFRTALLRPRRYMVVTPKCPGGTAMALTLLDALGVDA